MTASEKYVELPGSDRQVLPGARRTAPSEPEEQVEVTVVLRRGYRTRPLPPLEKVSGSGGAGQACLSRPDFAAEYGARPEDLSVLHAFARSHGLRIVGEEPARRSVRLAGAAGRLAESFGTRLFRYEHPGGSYRGREGPLRVPPELGWRVVAVLGLDNRPQAKSHLRRRRASGSAAPSYTPPEVGVAYSFPAGADGTGECIAVIELGGGYRSNDLAEYFQTLGVSAPATSSVSIDGAENGPTGDPDGPDAEVELDLEVSGSLAPGARLVAYFAPNTDRGFFDAVSSAVHDATNRPSIVSISWGGPEGSWTAQARAAFESVFEDAAALGVTVVASSGDDGADDGGPGSGLSVDFPASSPGVVACGGTRLVLSGASIVQETVWNDLSAGEGATGGGVSEDFGLPSYQAGMNVPSAPNGFVGRGVPDVAGDADPMTGFQVLIDGTSMVLGGTSAVAPLWAALFARYNQALGRPLGYVNPQLYSPGARSSFRGITVGGNGGYTAGPGWNACTGLGSPNGARLLAALGGG